jgi:hypothetical protein
MNDQSNLNLEVGKLRRELHRVRIIVWLLAALLLSLLGNALLGDVFLLALLWVGFFALAVWGLFSGRSPTASSRHNPDEF